MFPKDCFLLLSFIDIRDLGCRLQGTVAKFVNDAEHHGIMNCEEGSVSLQQVINRLVERAEVWEMKFSMEKCDVMHFML